MGDQQQTQRQRGKGQQKTHKLEITLRNNPGQGNGGRKGVVTPGHCTVKHKDRVTWEPKETDVRIHFPTEELFNVREVEIAQGRSKTLTVSDNVRKGRYPYNIFCTETGDYAEGGSVPVMIVH